MKESEHQFGELVDLERLQRVCDSLSAAFDITLGILDPTGTVLIASGWQDICRDYHRVHEETRKDCLESDLLLNERLREGFPASGHLAYRCANGLWHVAFPLVVAGEHVANVYSGQFFFDDDVVDLASFAERAHRLGFDERAYLDALGRVPVVSHQHVAKAIGFLADFVAMLGEMGLNAMLREWEHERLVESERRYRQLFVNATEGIVVFRPELDGVSRVSTLEVVDLNPAQRIRMQATCERPIGQRLSERTPTDERMRAYYDLVVDAVRSGQSVHRELHLRGAGAHELVSVYTVGGGLWALAATDITEVREAEQALRRQEEDIRRAYVDVLDAVTGGKLILLPEKALKDELGAPLGDTESVSAPEDLAKARRCLAAVAERQHTGERPCNALLSTTCEALENALKHAHGGTYQVFSKNGCIQVLVADNGPGIDFRTLPKATLVPGFSTAASLGMGFTIMLQLCERVLLCTRPGSTRIVLEVAVATEATPTP